MSVSQKDYPISDTLLQLLVWVITEGNIYYGNRTIPTYDIAQSKIEGIERIKFILDSLKLDYTLVKRDYTKISTIQPYRFRLKVGARNLLHKILPTKDIIPNWFWKLSERQFNIFIDEYVLGDGTDYRHYEGRNIRMVYSNNNGSIGKQV